MNGKLIEGLLDIGNSISSLSFDTTERRGKAGSKKASNNKMLAANNSALKTVCSVAFKIRLKPKSEEFAQEVLITVDNCLSCLLGLYFMIDQECILNNGKKLL